MIKYGDTISSQTTGQPIYGAQVTVLNAQGLQATIYSDEAGTIPLSQPILTDQSGYFSFYIDDGRYNVVVMAGQAEIARTNITMVDTLGIKQRALLVPVNEDGGTIAPADARKGMVLAFDAATGAPSAVLPNSFAGPAGASDSTFLTLTALQSIDPSKYPSPRLAAPAGSDGGVANGPFNYQAGDFTGRTDVVKIAAIPLSQGALVRQPADGVLAKIKDDTGAFRTQGDRNEDILNVRDFYRATDPDYTNAFERAIYRAYPQRRSIRLFVPSGTYYLSRQIIPARQIHIEGETELGTVLHFRGVSSVNAKMDGAFCFANQISLPVNDPAYTAKSAGTEAPFGNGNVYTDFSLFGGGEYSSISRLTIFSGADNNPGLKYAIYNTVRLHLQEISALQIGAVKTEAGNLQIRQGVTVEGNANYSTYNRVTTRYPREHGFITDGDDANNIQFVGCNAFGAAQFGFYDGVLLGNGYLACHADSGIAEYKSINPSNASRTSFTACYAEGRGAAIPWDIAPGNAIIMPQGAQPTALSGARNATLTGAALRGLAMNTLLNFSDNFDGFGMGSATAPFSRMWRGGMAIRGQGAGDGHFYQFVAAGQGINGGGDRGAAIIKTLDGSFANYILIDLSDGRHRPKFPLGLIATLPTYADNASATSGGLASGDMYKTATGEVRVVL